MTSNVSGAAASSAANGITSPAPSSSSSSPLVVANNIVKRYGDHTVLESLNVSVNAGEFVTLVGTSGCGKSTFLKMLLGTESPTEGRLLFNGKPIAQEPSPERGIVFQKYSVFPHLSVIDNIVIGLEFTQSRIWGRLLGRARKEARTQAEHWLKSVGLTDAKNKYPHQLSGGMQQRLAIAQALIKRPSVLLLDEPFGALDPGIRKDMHKLILSLWREYELTVFMVTHDLQEGFYLGTRLWVFDKDKQDENNAERYGATITYDLPVSSMAYSHPVTRQPATLKGQ